MSRAQIVWTARRAPTGPELRAIGQAWRAGLLRPGDRVSPARMNPDPNLEAARGRIALFKYELRKARGRARADAARVRSRREAARPKLGRTVKRIRGGWRDYVNAQIAELRGDWAEVWRARLRDARAPVLLAEAELETERSYQRDERRARTAKRAGRPAKRGAVAKAESDQEVEDNIDADLIPIWHRMKNRIRTAGSRATRTEAFLEWVSENRAEVDRMLSDMAAEAADEFEAELAAQEAAYYAEAAA